MTIDLGIDVAKAKLDVHLLEEQRGWDAPFANSLAGFQALHEWVQQHSLDPCHACLEATGRYGDALALFLYQHDYRVSVVNPAQIKAYAISRMRRNKTDVLDARLIADFCRLHNPPAWTPPDPAYDELQALVRHLDDLQTTRQQVRNRLQSGLTDAWVIQQWQTQLTLLDNQIQQVKQRIHDHLNSHPDLKHHKDLLTSIPGIGDLTAGKLLAELHDLSLFDNIGQIVAFAGLNPRQSASGQTVSRHTPISKMGPPSLRAALYMPAVVAQNHNPLLMAFAQRLRQNGLKPMEVVVAVMRKLLHLAYGVLKSGQPFDPHYLEKRAATP